VCTRAGLPSDFVERLDIRRHPLETQFAFEAIYTALRWQDLSDVRRKCGLRPKRLPRGSEPSEKDIADLFVEILRKVLYRGLSRRSRGPVAKDTLWLVAQAVQRSATMPVHERRISQIITFNVDDLLEREVNGSRRRHYLAQPICRASDFRPPSRRAIPVYHLHGFVPFEAGFYSVYKADGSIDDADPSAASLVFTDEQYWRMVGNPTGFASRIFCNALSDCCVFVGLSMTDINIMRWLAQDAIERRDDLQRLRSEWSASEREFDLGEDLSRHYWITEGTTNTSSSDESSADLEAMRADVVTGALGRRGVTRIDIPSWDSDVFRDWWTSCFLP